MTESPPTWSEVFPSSDDSGLLLTSGHSGSMSTSSGDSDGCNLAMELQESEGEERSLSQDESLGSSEGMCGENFDTLKKGPCWESAIEPPPEFQDSPPDKQPTTPTAGWAEKFASKLVAALLEEAVSISGKVAWSLPCSQECHPSGVGRNGGGRGPRLCWTPELPFSPAHRPTSRSSLVSRLSGSHNSLSVPTNRADDSSFITSAMSHDALPDISDVYNVPFDSDIYAVPVDMVRPAPPRPRRSRAHRRRRRQPDCPLRGSRPHPSSDSKRHSVPGPSGPPEPVHMTLHEVRQYLHSLYSSDSDQSKTPNVAPEPPPAKPVNSNKTSARKYKKNTFVINIKNKKAKESCELLNKDSSKVDCVNTEKEKGKKSPAKHSFSSNLKQTLCNIFRIRKLPSPDHGATGKQDATKTEEVVSANREVKPPFFRRALPPLPSRTEASENEEPDPSALLASDDVSGALEGEDADNPVEEPSMDFASSIEKVKDYGWYWGPISGEAAEKILSNEPDGSFIVRDSSDDHYIFSLTFKLNGCIRHVRIEHDQGTFSFGSCTKFKSHTIVDFIENAVEHSRSGRYLFFLHRRPVLGPMRVQLLHPVSRFKQVQSLQHMCRFVILRLVRRDLIPTLPLPRRVIEYLSTPHYYSEQLLEEDRSTGASPSADEVLVSFVPQGLS